MSRILKDRDLMDWEVFATSGAFGYPDRARIVFACLSDRLRRARFVEDDGAKADAERKVQALSDAELLALMEEAKPLK
jgi:hypothetical protein